MRVIANKGNIAAPRSVKNVLFLFLLSICFQNVTLTVLGGASIKPYHVMGVVLLAFSFVRRGAVWRFPGRWLSMAFLLLFIISFVNSYRFGIDTMLFNYAFFYITSAAVYNLGYDVDVCQWKNLVQETALAFLAILYVHIAINYQAMLSFFSDPWNGHPNIGSFFGGGVNLDASWLALFGVFFSRDIKGSVFLVGSLGVSVMYASRAGMMLSVLSFFYVYVIAPKDRNILKKAIMVLGVGIVAIGALSAYGGVILDRFLSIGSDSGSVGRENMWKYVPLAFSDSPVLGSGAGNAIKQIESVSGLQYVEDNVHNYFVQVLLDFGIIGFFVYLLLVAYVLKAAKDEGFRNSFTIYIVCWVIGSFVQFRGPDAMLAFMVAGWLLTVAVDPEKGKGYSSQRSHTSRLSKVQNASIDSASRSRFKQWLRASVIGTPAGPSLSVWPSTDAAPS
jgi:O-antigen ligase